LDATGTYAGIGVAAGAGTGAGASLGDDAEEVLGVDPVVFAETSAPHCAQKRSEPFS
jgi:hypothetical protein